MAVITPQAPGTPPSPVSTQTVDPNETVSGQITSLLSNQNPYIQQARNQGQQAAAQRGQLNGLMAAGAAQSAATQAALPIAQQDASEYSNVGNQNQSAQNTWLGQKLQSKTAQTVANTQAGAEEDVANIQAQVQRAQLAQQQSQFTVGEQNWQQQFGLSTDQFNEAKNEWQKTFGQNQQNFETNLDYSNYWNNRNMQFSANSNVLSLQSGIFQNPNMTADQRTAALNESTNMTSAYIQSLQGFQAWTPPWQASNSGWSFTQPSATSNQGGTAVPAGG